jgi:hypothetical protein
MRKRDAGMSALKDFMYFLASPATLNWLGLQMIIWGLVAEAIVIVFVPSGSLEKGLSVFCTLIIAGGVWVEHVGAEALNGPRILKADQQARVVERIKRFTGQEFEGAVATALVDGFSFWENLSKTLGDATWVLVIPEGLRHGNPPAAIPISANPGVMIAFAPEAPPNVRAAAQELAAVLKAEGLEASADEKPFGEMAKRPTMIMVVIGPKPQ